MITRPRGTLGMARICVFGLAAVSRVYCPVWEVAYLPDFHAVGIMRLLGADLWVPLITPAIGMGIHTLTIGLLLLVAAGIGPYRRLAPLACVALTISEGMVRGRGVIGHAHMILILTSYILCWFPAADALTLFRKPKLKLADPVMYRAPLVAASLVLGFTYLLAAARRFSNGGLSNLLRRFDLVCDGVAGRRTGKRWRAWDMGLRDGGHRLDLAIGFSGGHDIGVPVAAVCFLQTIPLDLDGCHGPVPCRHRAPDGNLVHLQPGADPNPRGRLRSVSSSKHAWARGRAIG